MKEMASPMQKYQRHGCIIEIRGVHVAIANVLLTSIIVLNILLGFVIVFLERRSVSSTWAWLMILAFIPILGFILYVVLGQNLRRRSIFRWDKQVHTFIRNKAAKQKRAIRDGDFSFLTPAARQQHELVYMNLNNNQAIFTHDNSVDVYTDGHALFEQLLQDIRQAKKHIHIQTYILRSDELGNQLADLLVEKAREGVEIRLLYDANGSRRLARNFVAKLRNAGVETVSFFPIRFPYLTFHLNYRNHRKITVIDGKIGYIGGFNIGDEYLGKDPKFGYWRDTHIRIRGTAVHNLQTRFLLDWNQAAKQSVRFKDYFGDIPNRCGEVGVQIVSSGPDTEMEHIKNGYIKMISEAKRYIYIQTPYFIPDESVLEAIKIAASSGVDVRIMVPSIPDHPFVLWASQSYFGELLGVGVKIYRYLNGFLHAKTIVIDDKVATVGTANMDVRSFRLNFEVNAFLYDEKLALELAEAFRQDIRQSKEWTRAIYHTRPLIVRIKESLCRLLSPIL